MWDTGTWWRATSRRNRRDIPPPPYILRRYCPPTSIPRSGRRLNDQLAPSREEQRTPVGARDQPYDHGRRKYGNAFSRTARENGAGSDFLEFSGDGGYRQIERTQAAARVVGVGPCAARTEGGGTTGAGQRAEQRGGAIKNAHGKGRND